MARAFPRAAADEASSDALRRFLGDCARRGLQPARCAGARPPTAAVVWERMGRAGPSTRGRAGTRGSTSSTATCLSGTLCRPSRADIGRCRRWPGPGGLALHWFQKAAIPAPGAWRAPSSSASRRSSCWARWWSWTRAPAMSASRSTTRSCRPRRSWRRLLRRAEGARCALPAEASGALDGFRCGRTAGRRRARRWPRSATVFVHSNRKRRQVVLSAHRPRGLAGRGSSRSGIRSWRSYTCSAIRAITATASPRSGSGRSRKCPGCEPEWSSRGAGLLSARSGCRPDELLE